MKKRRNVLYSLPLIAVLLFGCSEAIQNAVMAGAAGFAGEVALGALGVQTDGSMTLAAAAAGYQVGLRKEAERCGVDFSKIPPDWRGPNGEEIGKLSKDAQGRFCYNITDENGGTDYLIWTANNWEAKD